MSSKLDYQKIIQSVYDEQLNALRVTDGGGGGGGGGSYPEVNNHAALPGAGSLPGSIYLVLNASGIWPFTRKQSGLYFSNGSSWALLNALTPDEIATMYESNADVNRYSVAEKTKVASAIQTGINLGPGVGVFAQTSGTQVQFKTLVAGTNISLLTDSTTVTITSSGSSSSNSYFPNGWS